MHNLTNWIQAVSTAILAFLAIWVGFFSEVGDLTVKLLQSELLETKQEMKVIYREKEELENQKKQLSEERNELTRQREKHIVHVVNGRLMDLWILGVKTLDAYRAIAEIGQELLDKAEQFETYQDWNEDKQAASLNETWSFFIPDPEDVQNDRRTEWGQVLFDFGRMWNCSKDIEYVLYSYKDIEFDPQDTNPGTKERTKLITEWQNHVKVEERQRLTEYHVSCLDELESAVRQRIESVNGETALSIRGFSERLLEWPGINNVSKEVKERIQNRLMSEISTNSQLAKLTIQLQVTEGASLQEIAEEAKRVENNVKAARDWLDEATKDRLMWTAKKTYN